MSAKKARRWPRLMRGLLGYGLTLLLTASLVLACVLTLAEALLTDRALHERVALDDRVIDIQVARIDGEIRALAETHRFAPETVLELISQDYVRDYGREAVAWWMGLLTGESPAEAPFPDTSAIEEAVKADELFRENTEDFMRRAVARDEIAYPMGKTLQQTVLPIRVSLVSLAMPELTEQVDVAALLGLLGRVRSWLCMAAVAFLALLMLTQGERRCLYGSAGLLAADVLLIAMTACAALAKLPQAMVEMSAILSLQLSVLLEALLPVVLAVEIALLLLGAGMLILYGVKARRAAKRLQEECA